METSKEIVLSLSDFFNVLKKNQKNLLIAGLICGALLLFSRIQKPLVFTAIGTFKTTSENTSSTFSQALGSFFGDAQEKYSGADDPRYFLNSYPVLKAVVKRLNLQGTIHETSSMSKAQRVWYNIIAERVHRSSPPPSFIVSSKGVVTDREIFPNPQSSINCSQIEYPEAIATTLKIRFLTEGHFEIFEKNSRQPIGKGILGTPLSWKGGSFTLNAEQPPSKKEIFHLTLLPLDKVARDLSTQLIVKKDKENRALIYVKYRHTNRHLAAKIVNAVMEEFQNYLKDEGRKKASFQLDYLKKKQDDSLADLERVMENHRLDLEEHLGAGGMISLNQELEFLAREQSSYQAELSKLTLEMKRLYHSLNESEGSLSEIFHSVKNPSAARAKEVQPLTLESSLHLLATHQERLDLTEIELEHYTYALEKCDDSSFDCSSLAQIIEDPTLRPHFEKLNSLHHHLVDTKNWSEKERASLQETIGIEKAFLKKHLLHLKEGGIVKAQVAKLRIHSLQNQILQLLVEKYEAIEESLHDLALKVTGFPKKWLTEQKIELSKKIHTEIVESITKMIETKNIAYHTESISSSPLQYATSSLIPDPPKLLFYFLVGFFATACLFILYLFLREIFLGPSVSPSHLMARELTMLGKIASPSPHQFQELKARDLKTFRKLAQLATQKRTLLLIGQTKNNAAFHLLALLSKRNEKVLLIDTEKEGALFEYLEDSSHEIPLIKEKHWDVLLARSSTGYLEEIWSHPSFETLFTHLKTQYRWLVFCSRSHPKSIETRTLLEIADQTVFFVSGERFHEISSLPQNTAFIFQEFHEKTSPLILSKLTPFLDRMISRTAASFYSRQEF